MAGQSWSINIVVSGSTVAFNPDVYGAAPGSPLQAQSGDVVSWNNQTEADQTIVVNVSPAETFTAKSWSSTNGFVIQVDGGAGVTVTYTCSGQTGTIDVIE